MSREYVLEFADEESKELADNITQYCTLRKKTYSCTGIEIVSVIIDGAMLVVALLTIPAVAEAINKKSITVKFDGFVVKDPASKILNELKKDPEMLSRVEKAIIDNRIEISGSTKQANEFNYAVKALIEERRKYDI